MRRRELYRSIHRRSVPPKALFRSTRPGEEFKPSLTRACRSRWLNRGNAGAFHEYRGYDSVGLHERTVYRGRPVAAPGSCTFPERAGGVFCLKVGVCPGSRALLRWRRNTCATSAVSPAVFPRRARAARPRFGGTDMSADSIADCGNCASLQAVSRFGTHPAVTGTGGMCVSVKSGGHHRSPLESWQAGT